MLTTTPTQQSPATTALPPPAANESFCTWLCGRIKDIFQKILSWLCCSSSRNEATTPTTTRDTTPHTSPITNTRRTAPPVSPTISDPEPAPPPLFTTVPIAPDTSTTPTASAPAPTVPTQTTPAPIVTTPAVTPLPTPGPTAPDIPNEWSAVEPYIQSRERREALPCPERSQFVYFTDQFVIKRRLQTDASHQDAFNNTERARAICRQEGYRSLVVPKAKLYREDFHDFLVTQRLPVTMLGMKEQIGLYITHQGAFTQTARAFTALRCKAWLGNDIGIGASCDLYGSLQEGDFANYDHYPLFLEEGGEGRMGLVNLNEFRVFGENEVFLGSKWVQACNYAIHFFPLHFNEILDTVRQAGGTITPDEERQLTNLRDKTLRRFDIVYNNHAAFLRAHNHYITLDDPVIGPRIPPARKTRILDTLVESVQNQPAEAITRLRERLPEIWDIALNFISHLLSTQGMRAASSRALPENLRFIKMASCRSFIFHDTRRSRYRSAINAIAEKLNMIGDDDKDRLAEQLLDGIFTQLAQIGEIAYYNPRLNTDGAHCLFC